MRDYFSTKLSGTSGALFDLYLLKIRNEDKETVTMNITGYSYQNLY